MKIIECGKLSGENLRHPISAFYLHGVSTSSGFSDLLFQMFGFTY